MERKPRYAYFSKKAALQSGTTFYRKADGTEIEVTAVCESLEGIRNYGWKDKVFVGVVYDFIRMGREGTDKIMERLDKILR